VFEATIEASTVVAVAGAAGLGGLLTAAFGVRARRHEQTRELMLAAADEFSVEAAEVFVHLRHLKPPWEPGHRNLVLVDQPHTLSERQDALNTQLDRARRLSGRVRLLYGPRSASAAHAAQFLRHARYAAEACQHYWAELEPGGDPVAAAGGKTTRGVESSRERAWEHLESFADEARKAMHRPDQVTVASDPDLMKGVPHAY
jgi:hypothetical protein